MAEHQLPKLTVRVRFPSPAPPLGQSTAVRDAIHMSRADSPLRDRMVFLVGSQRSGTLWLQRILATHPDISSLPAETHLFGHAISRVAEIVHHGALSSPATGGVYMSPESFRDATRDYCDAIFGGVGAALNPRGHLILERSPNHVFHLELIASVYPDAAVVHMIRDGRDVARSQVARTYGPSSISEAAREWRRAIETARAAADGFRRYVEVRYEHLLDDPAPVVRRLFDELSLTHDDEIVQRALAAAKVTTNVDPGDHRVRRGKWQQSWSSRDIAAFLAEIGPLADEFEMDVPPTGRRRRATRLAGRKRTRPSKSTIDQPEQEAAQLQRAARSVNDFVSALSTGSKATLEQLSTAGIEVRVLDGDDERSAVGAAGLALLLDAARSDDIGWEHQVRGHCHAGRPTFTVLLTYVGDQNRTVDRVLVVRPRPAGIDKVTYYRFPSADRQRS